jgi:endonuclease G
MTVASFTHADILSVHCPLGCPTNPTKNDLVFGHVYALSNDPDTKFADWVAYEVDVLNFGDSPGRKWKKDPLLDDDETLEPSDYGSLQKALGADRGHQAPLASFAGSQYWSELNYLSNITPQDSDLNQGPWKSLEDAVRDAVGYRNSLFVITGPLYDGSTLQLPKADEPHKIPTAYFKVVYDLEGNSASFVMKQSAQRDDNFCDNHVTFNDVQGKTAFKLPKLTDNAAVLKRLGC